MTMLMLVYTIMLLSLLKKVFEVTYVENYLSTASGEGNQINIISEVNLERILQSLMVLWII